MPHNMVMERLDAAAELDDNQTAERQEAIAGAKATLLEAGVVDPGPKTSARVRISTPEAVIETVEFTDEERKALKDDGAVIYLPQGETIAAQRKANRPFWYITDGYKEAGKNRVTEFPSRPIEVAIYPDPQRFFVPDSFSKTTDQQDNLLAQDAQSLREKLRLEGITMIRPEVSEATEVFFKHFDATGVRLLGGDYIKDGYWLYMRTNTPTTKSGSDLANVGYWDAAYGLSVNDWNRGFGVVDLGAARWVVPQR